jgi:hypothetical protein
MLTETKKLWHPVDSPSARDLFDLSLVTEREPHALQRTHHFMTRHRSAFIDQLRSGDAVTARLAHARFKEEAHSPRVR